MDRDKKRQLLSHLIQQHNWFQVLVFTRTKHGANRLAELLVKMAFPLAIHGNKSQARVRVPWPNSRRRIKCWSPPTSPRAASTSINCRTS